MSRPWMPLYVADYLADTRRLTTLEHGAYILLIMDYWRNGGLPEDETRLARIAGLDDMQWQCVRNALAMLFLPNWRHKRIDEELRKAAEKSEKASASAANRWNKKDNQEMRTHSEGNANAMLSQPQSPLEDLSNDKSCPKPLKRHRTRKSYSEDFEQFWKAYPTDALMSKAEAAKAWEKLSDEDRTAAQRSIPAFRAYCGSHSDYRPLHACRYLSQRRFDGFAKTAETVSAIPLVAVSQNSPEGQAWEQFTRATKGKGVPWTNGIWRFPTQFPPEARAAE